MTDQALAVDLSHFSNKPAGSHGDDPGGPKQLRKNTYMIVIGVSFLLTCALYYVYFKNESQRDVAQINPLPAMPELESF